MISGLHLKNGEKLIVLNLEEIEQEDYNYPNLLATKPYEVVRSISGGLYITPYMNDYTDQDTFSFRTDDILTIFKPNDYLRKLYVIENGIEEQLELSLKVDKELNEDNDGE